jgi:hypothetical protein
LVLLFVFVYLHQLTAASGAQFGRGVLLPLGLAGLVVFALGYGIFLVTYLNMPSLAPTGVRNPVAIAGALGLL